MTSTKPQADATPLTDAAVAEFNKRHCTGGDFDPPHGQYVYASFARQLERALADELHKSTQLLHRAHLAEADARAAALLMAERGLRGNFGPHQPQ